MATPNLSMADKLERVRKTAEKLRDAGFTDDVRIDLDTLTVTSPDGGTRFELQFVHFGHVVVLIHPERFDRISVEQLREEILKQIRPDGLVA